MSARVWMVIAFASVLCGAFACAAEGDPGSEPRPSPDADASSFVPPTPAEDADTSDAVDAAADGQLPCSDAGWCATSIPDPAGRFYALVPLEQKAFALAVVHGRTTPLVFDGSKWNVIADDHWVVAPKNVQVLYALAAPSEHEIWVGGTDGYLARGVDTSGSWVFTVEDIGSRETVRSIFVANDREILVATDFHVLRGSSTTAPSDAGDGGRTWTIELVAPPVDAPYSPGETPLAGSFYQVIGTGPDDAWAIGGRGTCNYLAHRAAGRWTMLADSVAWTSYNYAYCRPYEDGTPFLPNLIFGAAATAPGELGGLRLSTYANSGADWQFYLRLGGPGAFDIVESRVPLGTTALWHAPERPLAYIAGFGSVQKNTAPFDGGTWEFSTVSLDGKAPTLKWLFAIGGVSEKNMWVAGDSYALHRTLP